MKRLARRIGRAVYLYTRIFAPLLFFSLVGYDCLIGFWGIGDCLVELSCIDDYKKTSKRKIAVFGHGPIERLFPFFPSLDRLVHLSKRGNAFVVDHKERIIQFCNRHKHLLFIGHYAYPGEDKIAKMRRVFGLEESGSCTYPIIPVPASIPSIPPNSVLVIPNSNFYQSDDIDAAFRVLIERYTRQGKTIFVNGDFHAEGVVAVYWDLDVLFHAAKQMERIVGIRTGLMEFLITCGTPIEVYYDHSKQGEYLYRFWPMNMWRFDADITEIIV